MIHANHAHTFMFFHTNCAYTFKKLFHANHAYGLDKSFHVNHVYACNEFCN